MLQFAGECKDGALEQRKKVRWSDEKWGIGVRGEADEVMRPSCPAPPVSACGGSAVFYGCCSGSRPGSATSWALGMRSAAYMNILIEGLFFFLDGTDIFPDDSGGIDQAQIVKEVFRLHHFQIKLSSFGHH